MKDSKKAEKTSKPGRDFWQGVKTEFKKISWPDKEALVKQSVVVVCISFALGAVIAVLDFIFQNGIDFMISL